MPILVLLGINRRRLASAFHVIELRIMKRKIVANIRQEPRLPEKLFQRFKCLLSPLVHAVKILAAVRRAEKVLADNPILGAHKMEREAILSVLP